jgi:hypothetical protein
VDLGHPQGGWNDPEPALSDLKKRRRKTTMAIKKKKSHC